MRRAAILFLRLLTRPRPFIRLARRLASLRTRPPSLPSSPARGFLRFRFITRAAFHTSRANTYGAENLHCCFRRAAKRARNAGVRVERGSEMGLIQRLYSMHRETRRRLGVPVQSLRFFELSREIFAPRDAFEVWLAVDGGRDAAGLILLRHGDRLYYKWSARSVGTALLTGAIYCSGRLSRSSLAGPRCSIAGALIAATRAWSGSKGNLALARLRSPILIFPRTRKMSAPKYRPACKNLPRGSGADCR